jgi:hypothetical protein
MKDNLNSLPASEDSILLKDVHFPQNYLWIQCFLNQTPNSHFVKINKLKLKFIRKFKRPRREKIQNLLKDFHYRIQSVLWSYS